MHTNPKTNHRGPKPNFTDPTNPNPISTFGQKFLYKPISSTFQAYRDL